MVNSRALKRTDLVHPQLSYLIIGAVFEVFNRLGYGHREEYYQRALAEELKNIHMPFEREKPIAIEYRGVSIGRYILDFVVDSKIVVELKVQPRLGYNHIKQVVAYLTATGLDLALLVWFTKDGVKYRRVLRPK